MRRDGFTLMEVMVVVLILAIAGALAVPLLGQTGGTQLRSAARLLAADVGYAKNESITHADAPRVIVFDKAKDRYHLAKAASPQTPLTNPATDRDYVTDFGTGRARSLEDVAIKGYSVGGDDQLEFGIYGELDQNSPATVTLTSGHEQITVTIDHVNGEATIGSIQTN